MITFSGREVLFEVLVCLLLSADSKRWFGTSPRSGLTAPRGYIGITMLSLTPDLIAALRLRHPDFADIEHGVLVHKVAVGSPAYK